jgi:hypothetical protein
MTLCRNIRKSLESWHPSLWSAIFTKWTLRLVRDLFKMTPFIKAVLATLLVVPAKIVASDTSLLPADFSWWFWQSCKQGWKQCRHLIPPCWLLLQAIVAGSRLYIDAGEIWARWGGSTNASGVWSMCWPILLQLQDAELIMDLRRLSDHGNWSYDRLEHEQNRFFCIYCDE